MDLMIGGVRMKFPVSGVSEAECRNGCSFLEDGSCPECTCRECRGGLIVTRHEDATLSSRPCSCQSKAVVRRRLKAAGLLEKAERCTLESFEASTSWQRSMLEMASKYVEDEAWRDGKGLFFAGMSGCGKSHLALACTGKIAERGVRIAYLRWVQDGSRLKALVADADAYEAAIEPYRRSRLLLIDDFLKSEPTAADLRLAFSLIDDRCTARLPTIFTSERSLSYISSCWNGGGEAVSGRILEICSPFVLEIANEPGRNYRYSRAV